jgi:tetratricopeptide (TPR) repeat protein
MESAVLPHASLHSHPHPHPDPQIAALVQSLGAGLIDIAEQLRAAAPAERGQVVTDAVQPLSPQRCDALYDIASRLCNEGQFQHALPIALHLETHAQSPRHGFIAATCLQRLNQPELAAPMYALCLVGNPRHVAAMFRLGECLAATGREEEAVQAFEATIDLGRADAAFVELQELARRRIDQLAARRIRN